MLWVWTPLGPLAAPNAWPAPVPVQEAVLGVLLAGRAGEDVSWEGEEEAEAAMEGAVEGEAAALRPPAGRKRLRAERLC